MGGSVTALRGARITIGGPSRVNIRWLLAGLMLTWVATMVPLLGTVSFGVLIACRVILGFAEGPAFALANHAAHSWFPPEKRAMAGGFVSAGASIGTLIAAPTLTWIIFAGAGTPRSTCSSRWVCCGRWRG